MNPSSPDHPGFELPAPPTTEAGPSTPQAEQAPVQSEKASKHAELPGSSLPPVPAPPIAAPPAGTTNPAQATSVSAPTGSPAMADDLDLIEKEWVDKAKAIVGHTLEDPHQQNKQLNAFKADYMKKRYGKEIRLTDE